MNQTTQMLSSHLRAFPSTAATTEEVAQYIRECMGEKIQNFVGLAMTSKNIAGMKASIEAFISELFHAGILVNDPKFDLIVGPNPSRVSIRFHEELIIEQDRF